MSIWPDPMPPVEMEVPAGTVAVVYMTRDEHGGVLAHYAEARSRVPAPREQIARVLTELAVVLLEQAEALDEAAAS